MRLFMSSRKAVISLILITVGFLLTLYFVAFAGIAVPQDPQYSFIYLRNEYDYEKTVEIENGKIVEKDGYCRGRGCNLGIPELFVFDTQTKGSTKITLDQTLDYTLSADIQAPDGYEYVEYARNSSFFGFGEDNVLQKDGYIVATDLSYQDRFLSWVIEN